MGLNPENLYIHILPLSLSRILGFFNEGGEFNVSMIYLIDHHLKGEPIEYIRYTKLYRTISTTDYSELIKQITTVIESPDFILNRLNDNDIPFEDKSVDRLISILDKDFTSKLQEALHEANE